MIVKDLGVKTVVAKAATAPDGRILEKIGVSRVVFAERDMAIRVAHSLVAPNVIDYFELSRDFSIVELRPYARSLARRYASSRYARATA